MAWLRWPWHGYNVGTWHGLKGHGMKGSWPNFYGPDMNHCMAQKALAHGMTPGALAWLEAPWHMAWLGKPWRHRAIAYLLHYPHHFPTIIWFYYFNIVFIFLLLLYYVIILLVFTTDWICSYYLGYHFHH